MPLALRAATLDDAHAIAAIYGPYVVSSVASFEDAAPGGKEMGKRMAASMAQFPWIIADMDGVPFGYATASKFRERAAYRWTVETSVYVAHDMRGQGIGRALYRALLGTLEEQGYAQAIAAIALPNDQSVDLHEAVGFQRAGHYREVGYKHGQWVDVGIWQRELVSPDDPPEEPRPFSEVGLQLE